MARQFKDDTTTSAADEDEGVSGAMFENNEDGLVIDLANVEAMKFEVLPKGDYNVVVVDNDYQLSKSSGQPMWNMQLSVIDEGEYQNRRIFTIASFSEKALPGTKAALAVLAPELLEGPFSPKNPEVVAGMVGRKAKVRVSIRKGTDEYPDDRNEVKRWMQPDGAAAFI